MIRTHVSKAGIKSYGVRLHRGKGRYEWLGTFATEREARRAEARALLDGQAREIVTVAEWTERFLARYERERKDSSTDTARAALKHFVADFGPRPIDSIGRMDAIDYAERIPAWRTPIIVTLFNEAMDAELVERNPFRGRGRRTRGRSDEHPPTAAELDALVDACSALGDYAPRERALLLFAAYSGLRPSELFALEWADIDIEAMRIDVRRRLYKGRVDLPKSNKPRRIALTPLARDAILGLPTRADGGLVFRSKTGKRLSQPTHSGYWGQVLARAGLDHDFYLATKHFCVHYMHATLKLEPRVIAEQMGWTLGGVLKLLAVYGHGDVGALEEIDRAFAENVVPLKPKAVGE